MAPYKLQEPSRNLRGTTSKLVGCKGGEVSYESLHIIATMLETNILGFQINLCTLLMSSLQSQCKCFSSC